MHRRRVMVGWYVNLGQPVETTNSLDRHQPRDRVPDAAPLDRHAAVGRYAWTREPTLWSKAYIAPKGSKNKAVDRREEFIGAPG